MVQGVTKLRCIKTRFEKISGRPFRDSDPRCPNGVWDKVLFSKKILVYPVFDVWVVKSGGYLGKKLILDFKQSFLSPWSLKACYDP